MVKFALSFAALAAVIATVASAPMSQSPLTSHFSFLGPNECVPETTIKEYHPFRLRSAQLRSFVSKKFDANLLVGGIAGEKTLEELEMCIASTDLGCDKNIRSNCIYQNVSYRFRVNSPVKGYLKVVRGAVEIVSDFHEASELNLYKKEGWGLRVAQGHNDESRLVFSTTGGGRPLTLEPFVSNKASQWFEIVDSTRRAPSTPNKCVPETSIKEYHPFTLLSSKLDTFVSKSSKFPFLVGGVTGSKALQQMEFCIVSSEHECSSTIHSNCIFENVEYRFRVNAPDEGYLKIDGDVLKVVPKFKDASGLTLYKEAGWGLRVAHVENGITTVLATNGGGVPLTMEKFKANDARQWFQIIEDTKAETVEETCAEIVEETYAEIAEAYYAEEESYLVPPTPNQCVPETTIKEYHPFTLLSSQLGTFVSKPFKFPFLVGGVTGSKAMEMLEFCIVSSDHECSKTMHSNCIYENVEYRFRVNGPIKGYLKIDGNLLEVVPSFKEASGLNLYKKAGWGLRVAHVKHGFMTVLATNGGGEVLNMEEFKENDARQWFQIIEDKKAEEPYRRF
ncbi:unnamed protein product [Mortierella alpina]